MADTQEERSLVVETLETALTPVRAALSKPAQRAYLGTFVFAATSLTLLGIATVAYALFYLNFVPQVGFERVIHLQFGNGNPQGVVALGTRLVSLQHYDITVNLNLPRTPSNIAAGNFMLELSLLSPSSDSLLSTSAPSEVLAHSLRPAILTYASPIIDTANKVSQLPWFLLGWRKEAERLEVSMMEGVTFAKGWRNVPSTLRLEIHSAEPMQIYEATVKLVAKFSGLRQVHPLWIMYNHRILSFLAFTGTFWSVSMTSSFVAWFALSTYFSSSSDEQGRIKQDPDTMDSQANGAVKTEEDDEESFDAFSTEDLSDTQRTFPTLGRQMPLRFPGRSSEGVKWEETEEQMKRTAGNQPLTGEADDEDEYMERRGGRTDSGLGTSLDEEASRKEGVQRRRNRLFGGGGR